MSLFVGLPVQSAPDTEAERSTKLYFMGPNDQFKAKNQLTEAKEIAFCTYKASSYKRFNTSKASRYQIHADNDHG